MSPSHSGPSLPKPLPPLNIPHSSNTVEISIINTTSRIQNIPSSLFVEPSYKGFPHLDCPAFSFLITHPPTGSRYLFDLGVRKDHPNLSPSIANRIATNGWRVTTEKDVASILLESGVIDSLASINGIIWSHHHWDHTGDPSTFPPSTSLIVGPGFKEAFVPGYPMNQMSPILEADYRGREMTEVSFDDDDVGGGGLRLGGFRAVDFFGDGSFYLLDSPGHAVGHLCGLARTTLAGQPAGSAGGNSDTFMLLGGDVAHHGGEFRPTPYLSLPSTLDPSPIPGIHPGVCPGDVMAQQHRLHPGEGSWTQPFLLPSGNAAHDLGKALESIETVEKFDGHPEVFTCLAHDNSLVGVVGCFPDETANGWREKGWKEKVLWRWLGDFYGGVNKEGGLGER